MLLYNGSGFTVSFSLIPSFLIFFGSYPPSYVHSRFMKFFEKHLRITSTIPLIDDENDYVFIRSYLINTITPAEHQMASRIAQRLDTDIDDTENKSSVEA